MKSDDKDQGRQSAILPRPDMGPFLRTLSGVVGLVLLVVGCYSLLFDEGDTAVFVPLILGGFFLYLAFSGRPGRMTLKTPAAEVSFDPHPNVPIPDRPQAGELSPPPETSNEPRPVGQDMAVADGGSASDTVQVEKQEPFIQAMDAYADNDYRGFDSKMQEAIAAAEDEERKVSLEALRLAWLYNSGQTEKLDEMEALRRQHPESHVAVMRLGECFEVAGDHDRAAQLYEEGLATGRITGDASLALLSRLSRALAKAKRFEEAEEVLTKRLEGATSDRERAKLHKLLSDLYEEWGRTDRMHSHLEKSLELNPGDTEARFNLAYSYFDAGWPLAAAYHYNILRSQRGGPDEANNLAVALAELDMPITAMRYYRRAADDGYTLAAANFARKAAQHGFVDEAKSMLSDALKREDVDDSVHSAASAIAGWEKEESERVGRIVEAGDTVRLFLLRRTEVEIAANASMKADEAEGVWRTTLGDITLDRQENKLGGRFKENVWDWELLGEIEKRTYSFKWKCDHPGQNQHGDGYFLFTTDSEFEGIIQHTPEKGEVRVVTGRKQPPRPRSEEGSLPTLGERLAPDDVFKRALDFLEPRLPPTQPPGD